MIVDEAITTKVMGMDRYIAVDCEDTNMTTFEDGATDHIGLYPETIRFTSNYTMSYKGQELSKYHDNIHTRDDISAILSDFDPNHERYVVQVITNSYRYGHRIDYAFYFQEAIESADLLYELNEWRNT